MRNNSAKGKEIKALIFIPLMMWGMMTLPGACNRRLESPLPTVSNAVRDTAGNIRAVLRNSSFHLFNQAFVRTRLDSNYDFYTVFAPSDSAMTAVGLTSATIDNLPADSLDKIVGYHIARGVYGDTVLENTPLTVQAPTVRQDANFTYQYGWLYYQQNLYIRKKGTLYINGIGADQGERALKASNGWIHPVDRVLKAPDRDLWSIIRSRPELSMYAAAIQLVDSVGGPPLQYLQTSDTTIFSAVLYSSANSPNSSKPMLSTVFAPTNTAFTKAGFNTVDTIRQYILNSQALGNAGYVPGTSISLINYVNMDSVLKLHYLYTPDQSLLLYQDLLSSTLPVINKGQQYTDSIYVTQYFDKFLIQPFSLQFYDKNGTVYIKWSSDPSVALAPLPLDPGRSFVGTNGVIYETDQLFYPHN